VLDEGACVALVTQADVDAAAIAAFDEGVPSVDITSNDQEVYDGAYTAGAASVDITTDNEASYNEGVASVDIMGAIWLE